MIPTATSSLPTPLALSPTYDYMEGSAKVVAVVNPTTHNMNLAPTNATDYDDHTDTMQSVTDTNGDYGWWMTLRRDIYGYYSTPSFNYNWMITGIGMSPVKFNLVGTYNGDWWQ